MKTILVVDDNELVLESARQVLQDEYKIIPAMKGEEALSYLESGECDLVLLDIDMPEMDGFAALEKMREMEHCRNLPVIFIADGCDADTEARCYRSGAADVIAKPFVPETMRFRIGRALELEELRRGLADKHLQKTREVFEIWSKSHQDALTGLWNRTYTEQAVNGLLARGVSGAMMMIDVDDFKLINDSYGHIVGDRALKILAGIMREVFGEEDILCRMGGDEFVIFVKNETSKVELAKRAKEIILRLGREKAEIFSEMRASISIGIAQAPEDGNEFAQLYSCADKALYYVKQNGKGTYHFYSERLEDDFGREAKTVDLNYLQDLMGRKDNGTGAFLLDFESFNNVYNFIHRFIDRSNRDVQTVLCTVSESGKAEVKAEEFELVLELLEKAIYTSLRRSDVSTRYSSRQLIVILMDVNSENGDMVAERIIENFYKLYTRGQVRIDYGIARMDTRGGL